jgi:hypothetical protein
LIPRKVALEFNSVAAKPDLILCVSSAETQSEADWVMNSVVVREVRKEAQHFTEKLLGQGRDNPQHRRRRKGNDL